MNLIKQDLKKLGISHDNFFSESELVKKDLVKKTVLELQRKNYIMEGYLDPPKGEIVKKLEKDKKTYF